jgi:predicted outer membrane repeat protein
MKANIIFVSMIAVLVVLTGATILSGCGNPTGGGGGGGSSTITHYLWVATTGSDDAGYGTSETHAYRTIGHALNLARPNTMIRVMDGLYNENLTWSTFESVSISGESMNGTIISGEMTDRCITISSSAVANQTILLQSLTIINGSSGSDGGGIIINKAGITLHLKNVVMMNNSAGTSSNGGAICGGDNNVLAENCTFESNAAGYGGAIYLPSATGGYLSATNCVFSSNSAIIGGAIYVPYITLEACSLSGNNATNTSGFASSGAVYVGYSGKVTNSLFFNNQVHATGGNGYGGAIHQANTTPSLNIVNCTFASNEVTSNVASDSGAVWGQTETNLTNCILYGNFASTSNPQINTVCNVNYSDVQGGYSGTGANNVNDDPAFFGTLPFSAASDLSLTVLSPADVTEEGTFSGAPTKDYIGHSRTGHMSMGAYQY